MLGDADKRQRYDAYGHAGLGGGGRLRSHDLRGLRRHPRRLLRLRRRLRPPRAGRPAARQPTCATTSSSPSRKRPSAPRPTSRSRAPRPARPAAGTERRRAPSPSAARPAGAPARSPSSRASSAWPAPAAAAAAPGGSWPARARPATARARSRSSASSRSRSRPGSTPAASSASPAKAKAAPWAARRATSTSSSASEEHAVFKRDGTSLFCEFPVTIAQAALGGRARGPDPRRRQDEGRRCPRGPSRARSCACAARAFPTSAARAAATCTCWCAWWSPQAQRRAEAAHGAAREDPPRRRAERQGPDALRPHEGHPRLMRRLSRSGSGPRTRTSPRAPVGAGTRRHRESRAGGRSRCSPTSRPPMGVEDVRASLAGSPAPRVEAVEVPTSTGSHASARPSAGSRRRPLPHRSRLGRAPRPGPTPSWSIRAGPSGPAPTRRRASAWPRSAALAAERALGRVLDVGNRHRHPGDRGPPARRLAWRSRSTSIRRASSLRPAPRAPERVPLRRGPRRRGQGLPRRRRSTSCSPTSRAPCSRPRARRARPTSSPRRHPRALGPPARGRAGDTARLCRSGADHGPRDGEWAASWSGAAHEDRPASTCPRPLRAPGSTCPSTPPTMPARCCACAPAPRSASSTAAGTSSRPSSTR